MSTISKIDYLRGKIASSYEKGINVKELGDVALELLLLRNEVYRKKEEEGLTVKEQGEVKKTIDDLHELERFIISLYMVSGLKKMDKSYTSFSSFRMPKYSYHKRD